MNMPEDKSSNNDQTGSDWKKLFPHRLPSFQSDNELYNFFMYIKNTKTAQYFCLNLPKYMPWNTDILSISFSWKKSCKTKLK
jgi:hypothetical protein